MADIAKPMQLQHQTLQAFLTYIREAEEAMQPSFHAKVPFLWSDEVPDRAKQIHHGTILAQLWCGSRPVKVPDGLIHDWIGAVFVPHATVEEALARVQDYDNHKNIYQPEVMDSKLISHHGNNFKIYLRLLKKKVYHRGARYRS